MTPTAGADGPAAPAVAELGDWRRPETIEIREVLALLEAVAAADGVAAVSGHVMEAIERGTARWVVARRSADAPAIGVAVALGNDPAELAVHPDHRRHGWGTELARAAVARGHGAWAYGDLPGARAIAGMLGLRRGRVLLQLRRTLPLEPDPAAGLLPPGVRIRRAEPGDHEAIVAVNARAFAWHPEQGRMTLDDLHGQMAEAWFDPAGLFVAVTGAADAVRGGDNPRGDRVLGFHWTKVHQGSLGEVYVLAVDPESGVRGLGGPLTRAGLDHLTATGQDTVMLYVEADNERARRLYERMGFRTAVTSVVYV